MATPVETFLQLNAPVSVGFVGGFERLQYS
jgi:hypothetical protein